MQKDKLLKFCVIIVVTDARELYWVSQYTSHAAADRLWSFQVTITMRTMLLTLCTSVGPSI